MFLDWVVIIKYFCGGVNYQFKAVASCGGFSITRVKSNGNNAMIEIKDIVANKIPVWSIPAFINHPSSSNNGAKSCCQWLRDAVS